MAQARNYLVRVFEDAEKLLPDRMDALKLARRFEAAKVALPTVHAFRNETDRRERWRVYEQWLLRRRIIIETRALPRKAGTRT